MRQNKKEGMNGEGRSKDRRIEGRKEDMKAESKIKKRQG